MENLQRQVTTLSSKVDALYQMIEKLGDKLSDVVAECRVGTEQIQHLDSHATVTATYRNHAVYSLPNISMEHKDVLMDDASPLEIPMHQGGEKPISAEIQIQRLTAQLTAAYNRIAALEEQLLSQRIH